MDFVFHISISIHLMLLFIIISKPFSNLLADFNTSHVTVYRFPCVVSSILSRYFNTSHVTVYRCTAYCSTIIMCVFQYISCYCLSPHSCSIYSLFVISIHLMLLFIPVNKRSCKCIYCISIHLMLLFI